MLPASWKDSEVRAYLADIPREVLEYVLLDSAIDFIVEGLADRWDEYGGRQTSPILKVIKEWVDDAKRDLEAHNAES